MQLFGDFVDAPLTGQACVRGLPGHQTGVSSLRFAGGYKLV